MQGKQGQTKKNRKKEVGSNINIDVDMTKTRW